MNIDIFNDDAFSLSSLTAAINNMPLVPGRLGALGLFNEDGISTLTCEIEYLDGVLSLIEASERGAPATKVQADDRRLEIFKTVHIKREMPILADEIQGLRAFGKESELETMQNYVNQRLLKIKLYIDATHEYHRIGAMKGIILDADGLKVIYNLFQRFGITQQEVAMTLGSAATNVRGKVLEAIHKSEDVLQSALVTGYRAFCGRNFFNDFVGHDKVEKAYEQYNQGEMLRNDPRGGFDFAGVRWEEYRGKVGSMAFIGDDEAYLVPEGVADLFITRFAPADYVETVNTLGLPYYSRQEMMHKGRGIDGEAQSNFISLCTNPRSVIKLKKGAS